MTCTGTNMVVEIEQQHSIGLHKDYLRLNDPACTLNSNDTHVSANISLNACGTLIEVNLFLFFFGQVEKYLHFPPLKQNKNPQYDSFHRKMNAISFSKTKLSQPTTFTASLRENMRWRLSSPVVMRRATTFQWSSLRGETYTPLQRKASVPLRTISDSSQRQTTPQ